MYDCILCHKTGFLVYARDTDDEENEDGGVNREVSDEVYNATTQFNTTARNQQGVTGSPTTSSDDNKKKPRQIRLCNGEIFFIIDVRILNPADMYHSYTNRIL